jgi:hypothetical protein
MGTLGAKNIGTAIINTRNKLGVFIVTTPVAAPEIPEGSPSAATATRS